jgi:hypothetical protein
MRSMNSKRIPRWSKLALAAATLALPLVACGDDDDVDEGTDEVEEGVEDIQEGVEDTVQDALDEADEEMADTSE